ncbi:hypothetical protein AB0G00_32870 [Nocardia salmonicida]|uniref:hypothetical protein n=1 Tax=Nocardia TaxID=1817 RepID=UPI00265851B4|nr:hypothetical protein [Nocardia sp. PE-7]WKG11749.1 hypothetical protein QX204_09945 [Nocardia sp. PE-7]
MSASIVNRGNGTDLERAWWYDTTLAALDPDCAALIDAIGARVRWCPPCPREPSRHRTAQLSVPSLRSSEWPTATQRSLPPLE